MKVPVDLAVLLPAASDLARRVDWLFFSLLGACLAVFSLLTVALFYCLIRYRAGNHTARFPLTISSAKIEATWAVLTLAGFLVFFYWGAQLYLDQEQPSRGDDIIDVTGRQWMWDIRHPNGRREFNELHVAIGEQVRLRMTSEDVIHSFYVPALRMKQDVVPGKQVRMDFLPDRIGDYPVYCAQYCGTEHAQMLATIHVQSPENYAGWLSASSATTTADHAQLGRDVYIKYGCAGCHSPGATTLSPQLAGLYGKKIPLRDGSFATVDDGYLRDSILLPNKQIAAGYSAVMPSYQGVIPEGELLELLGYLRTLHEGDPLPAR